LEEQKNHYSAFTNIYSVNNNQWTLAYYLDDCFKFISSWFGDGNWLSTNTFVFLV